jgi:hypothetical protein
VQLLTALPLAYVCVCAYFALFRLNAFDYNKLLPRATKGAALMQNGSLMCRFAPATCWNLLHVIRMVGGRRWRAGAFARGREGRGWMLTGLTRRRLWAWRALERAEAKPWT